MYFLMGNCQLGKLLILHGIDCYLQGLGEAIYLQQTNGETNSQKTKRIFVPSLTMAYFSTYVMDFLVTILVVTVTLTFFHSRDAASIAITSQLSTVSSITAVITGILVAFFSVRFKRKNILLLGAAIIPIGVIGCALAPNILTMFLFFPLDGIGSIIVGSMVFAVAAESLQLSKRAKAISYVVSGATWAQFFGAIFIRYIFGTGDWRSYLLFYGLPISLFALIFVFLGVSSLQAKPEGTITRQDYVRSFKEIFSNRSATACLVGNMTRHAGMQWSIFSSAFFQIIFNLSLADYALLVMIGTLLYASGNIIGGNIVERVGRKRQVLICFTLIGIIIMSLTFIPILLLALGLGLLTNFLGGLGAAGSLNMTVEQVSRGRGTIMSLSTVFVTIGASIGSAVGGAVLALTGTYQAVGLTLGAFSLLAAGIYLTTRDPCRIVQPK